MSAPTTTRLETLLSSLMGGRALTYTSGLSAFHALMVHLNPRLIAIGDGYHGVHGVLKIQQKLTGIRKIDIDASDAEWDAAGLGPGDVVHAETPLNPTGEAYNLSALAERAHARGAYLVVDATFGPPPLQDPFAHGVDVIMHSGTKYLGGHSDLLCGVLVVKRDDWWWQLYRERLLLGSVMGNMEGWLGLRSMRTLELRVRRQSENATELVRRLDAALSGSANGANGEVDRLGRDLGASSTGASVTEEEAIRASVYRITHASLQMQRDPSAASWLPQQMPNGYGACFSIWLKNATMAKTFPSTLELFHHATSLGGVESLIEWRSMTDEKIDPRVLRLSIGVEGVEDLWADVVQGLRSVLKQCGEGAGVKTDVVGAGFELAGDHAS